MAEFSLDLGASIDVVTGKEFGDGIDNLKKDLFGRKKPKPIYSARAGSVIMPAANPTETYIDLGRPPVGRVWNVLGITTAGNDSFTTVASANVSIYCGDSDSPSLVGLKVTGLAVPETYTVGEKVFWCHSTEHLVAGVSGAVAADSQVLVIAHIAEWVECDITANSGR